MRIRALSMTMISLSVAAQSLPEQLLERSLPTQVADERLFNAGPAIMAWADSISLSTVKVKATSASDDCPTFVQDGTGNQQLSISAQSYQQLDTRQTVRGHAVFTTGQIRVVRLSNSIDYQIVAPYVLGDDTGGDLTYRRYDFGGGYACKFTNRLTLGADLSYRAEIAWRDVDPRVKTIVSDLSFTVGAAYQLGCRYIVAIDAKFRSYTQNSDIDFYNPINDINTLPFTGMGTFNKRFSGNTNKSSAHIGIGYSVGSQWITRDGRGLRGEVRFSMLNVEERLRNFNNITLAYTDTYQTTASLGYGIRYSKIFNIRPTVLGSYKRRLGTENLFGTASGASYNKIGSRSPYLLETWLTSFDLPSEIRIGQGYITLHPAVTYDHIDESLSSYGRSMSIGSISGGVNVGYRTVTDCVWLWAIYGGYTHAAPTLNNLSFPGADAENALDAAVIQTYKVLSTIANMFNIEGQLNRQFGKVMAGISAGYSISNLHRQGHRSEAHASIFVKF